MGEPEESKKEVKEEVKYSVENIPTQTTPMISDGKKAYTLEEALVIALNKLDNMEKKIVG